VTAVPEEQDDPNTTAAVAEVEAEVEAHAAARYIGFSDAVIAIAMTLLALALPVPGGAEGLTNGQFLHALRADWIDYLNFLISFFVIGGHWSSHRAITRYVCALDRVFTRLNMLWLLMMILTPFATRLLSSSGGFGVRFAIYALIQLIATASLVLMSREVVRGNLLLAGAPERVRHPDNIGQFTLCAMFALSIPVAFATDTIWPYVPWMLTPMTARAIRHLQARRRQLANDDTLE
jgi:uncharacterized membrane protein